MRLLLHALKSLVVGVVAAFGALVVAVLVVVLLDSVMYGVAIADRVGEIASGGLGVISPSLEPAMAAMAVGAVAGFWIMFGRRDGSTHGAR